MKEGTIGMIPTISSGLLTFAILIAAACSIYAAYEVGDGKVLGSSGNSIAIKASKNVWVDYTPDSVSGLGYLLGSYHTGGTHTFGTSAGDTKVYKHDSTHIALPATVPTGSQTADFTGWTMM